MTEKTPLLTVVRNREQMLFPEFHETVVLGEGRATQYAPSHHVQTGLINEELIHALQKEGKTLLSVGAGLGYLERFLVRTYRIPYAQIMLVNNTPFLPRGFPQHYFDMSKPWPALGKQFDYILFPESLYLEDSESPTPDKDEVQTNLKTLLERALPFAAEQGQIRMTGTYLFYLHDTKTVTEHLQLTYPHIHLSSEGRLFVAEKNRKK